MLPINGKLKVVFIGKLPRIQCGDDFCGSGCFRTDFYSEQGGFRYRKHEVYAQRYPTLGTMDGANVEIVEEVGEENAFIFGLSSDEVINYENHGGYDPNVIYNTDGEIRQVLMELINGKFSSDTELFRDLYDSLLTRKNTDRPDRYFILADFLLCRSAEESGGGLPR